VILLALIPVTGVVAGITIPAYQDYTIRAQVSDGLVVAAYVKAAVAEAFLYTGSPAQNRIGAGLSANSSDSSSSYVAGVDVSNGVVIITYGNQAHPQIAGKVLTLTPYESYDLNVVWRCGSALAPLDTFLLGTAGGAPIAYLTPSIPNQYLPSACRP